jgi:hypothetical protein
LKSRRLSPEILDRLPPDDPAARASRRDLQRLHPILGQIRLWHHWFRQNFPHRPPASLADLGAGDGSLLGTVLLRAYPGGGHGARIFFIDRQPVVPESTLAHLRRCNWLPTVMATDVFEWAEEGPPMDAALANLFLHHFDNPGITRLFSALARKTGSFAAAEPRRSYFAFLATQTLGLIGCHPVTRHDARVSVEAGFAAKELGARWPSRSGWFLQEKSAGPFTHFFSAMRIS